MPKKQKASPNEMLRLAQKLSSGQDITQDEAESIKSLFSASVMKTSLNVRSSKFDPSLGAALVKWYEAVDDALQAKRTGNFINTVYLYFHEEPLVESILKCLSSLDKIDSTKIAQAVGFPSETGKAIAEKTSIELIPFDKDHGFDYSYDIYGFRFNFCDDIIKNGIYPFVKDYVPIVSPGLKGFDEQFYSKISPAKGSQTMKKEVFVKKEDLKKYIIAMAIRDAEIKTIFLKLASKTGKKGNEQTLLCARKEDVPLILSWAAVSAKDIVEKLFLLEKITDRDIKLLMEGKTYCNIKLEAILEGIKIIKELAQMEQEAGSLQDFGNWLETTR